MWVNNLIITKTYTQSKFFMKLNIFENLYFIDAPRTEFYLTRFHWLDKMRLNFIFDNILYEAVLALFSLLLTVFLYLLPYSFYWIALWENIMLWLYECDLNAAPSSFFFIYIFSVERMKEKGYKRCVFYVWIVLQELS